MNPQISETALVEAVKHPTVFDVVVIGGGVAGLTSGLYAARDGFSTLVMEGTMLSSTDSPGGALLLTSEIANYPGFPADEGAALVGVIREQAENSGAIIREERAENLIISEEKGKCHTILSTSGDTYRARAVIIATGSIAKRLNVPGENEMFGRGVSTCATCDGFFFKNKTVAVSGGGDTAVEDAILLTRYAEKVYLLVRGDKLKATGPEAREIIEHPDVEILWETTVDQIISNEEQTKVIGVAVTSKTGITHEHVKNDCEGCKECDPEAGCGILPIDGFFIAIGSNPSTGFLEGSGVPLDSEGYVLTENNSTKVKNIPTGVFAAGDVADKIYRQAITSAGKAAQASMEARAYLNHNS